MLLAVQQSPTKIVELRGLKVRLVSGLVGPIIEVLVNHGHGLLVVKYLVLDEFKVEFMGRAYQRVIK